MKLQAILVDDEKPALETLGTMLESYCPEVEILGTFSSVDEVTAYLRDHEKPTLLFLDIRMPGKDGFSLFQEADLSDIHVIFTTAYDNYALRAFTVSACHYLLKPIGPTDLIEAVNRAKDQSNEKEQIHEKMSFLKEVLKTRSENYPDRMLIPVKKGYEIVQMHDVIRFEGDRNYARIFLQSGRMLTIAKTLMDIESLLNPTQFFRVHQSHIICLSEIVSISSGSKSEVTLKSGDKFPVSRHRRKGLMDVLKSKW